MKKDDWWKLDGEYLAPDVVDMEKTPKVLERFPDGVIAIGQYMGKDCLGAHDECMATIIANDGKTPVSFHQQHYVVTEVWPETPFRVRVKKITHTEAKELDKSG